MAQQVELACRAADTGRFDEALRLCAGVGPERIEYSACRALAASIYRQSGRHDLAEPLDDQALAAPRPDELGRAMAALGLVADRVGAADAPGARSGLLRAREELAQVPPSHWAGRWFDPWLTAAWVSAEVSLLAGDPASAVAELLPLAGVRPRAVANTRWPHERAKTLLFLGVAQRCAGQPAAAADNLARAIGIAVDAGLAPLVVPAVEQLAELDEGAAQRYREPLAQARATLRRHLPPGA